MSGGGHGCCRALLRIGGGGNDVVVVEVVSVDSRHVLLAVPDAASTDGDVVERHLTVASAVAHLEDVLLEYRLFVLRAEDGVCDVEGYRLCVLFLQSVRDPLWCACVRHSQREGERKEEERKRKKREEEEDEGERGRGRGERIIRGERG